MHTIPLIVTYIIDDDKLHHFGMKRMLQNIKTPINLFQFYNGLQAINYIKENLPLVTNLPDMIFLDLNMPVMNGWQFLDEFLKLMPGGRAGGRRTTIYMVTSSVSDDDVAKAASYSEITEYIVKPASIHQMKNLFTSYEQISNPNTVAS